MSDDLLHLEDNLRSKRRAKILITLLILYFLALFGYGLFITREPMPFFTRVAGYDSYEQKSQISMRFTAFDAAANAQLDDFQIRLRLQDHVGGDWVIFDSSSRGEPIIDANVALPPDIKPGSYTMVVETTGPRGMNQDEMPLAITAQGQGRMVDIVQLEEQYRKYNKPARLDKLDPPLWLHVIPNDGRFTPSLECNLLLVLETQDKRVPGGDLDLVILSDGKPLTAEPLRTDAMGMAHAVFVPNTLSAHVLTVEVTDPKQRKADRKTDKAVVHLSPQATQIAMTPRKVLLAPGEPLAVDLSTLKPGLVHVDVFQGGNWVHGVKLNTGAVKETIQLPIPSNVKGMVYIQAALDVENPGTSYAAFYAYIADDLDKPWKSGLNPNKDKDYEERKDKQDKVAVKFWNWINANFSLDAGVRDQWLEKANFMPQAVAPEDYDFLALADMVLRRLPKDYYLLPELMNSQAKRMKAYKEKQMEKRNQLLLALLASGVLVVIWILWTIFSEMSRKNEMELDDDEHPMDEDEEHALKKTGVGMLWLLLITVIAGYGGVLYLLYTMNWYIGL